MEATHILADSGRFVLCHEPHPLLGLDSTPERRQNEDTSKVPRAMQIPPDAFEQAVKELGTGWEVTAPDTVPFCLWCAAYQLASFEDALWKAIAGGGDRDTISAIVGGIVALSVGQVPEELLNRREPLQIF